MSITLNDNNNVVKLLVITVIMFCSFTQHSNVINFLAIARYIHMHAAIAVQCIWNCTCVDHEFQHNYVYSSLVTSFSIAILS